MRRRFARVLLIQPKKKTEIGITTIKGMSCCFIYVPSADSNEKEKRQRYYRTPDHLCRNPKRNDN